MRVRLRWPGLVTNCARRTTNIMVPPSSLVPFQGWGLIDLPLRASNEGSPRPRVARAQKIIRLHPLLPSPLPKYSLWVYHEPEHQGTLILMGVWVSVVKLVLG